MKLFLTFEGMERLATDKELYSWHYTVCAEGPSEASYIEKGYAVVAEFTVTLPSKEAMIAPVLAYLDGRAADLQAETQTELMKLQQRKNDLLCLTMAAPNNTEAEGDFL